MTVTDTPASRRPRYLMPYPDESGNAMTAAAPGWDGRVDTLPLLRTTDIRSMERLRAIHAYARRGITEIDAVLNTLDQAGSGNGSR
ncbi:hypothetical protein ACWDRB_66565 [Nonomuraea sp. NPDC003707]